MNAPSRAKRLGWFATATCVAIAAAVAVWNRTPHCPAEQLFEQAVTAIEQGDRQSAADFLDELLACAPNHHRGLLYRGQLSRELGDPEQALVYLRRVRADSPREAGVARFLEGALLLEQNQARPAEQALLRSAELHPTYPQPHERLIGLYAVQLRESECREQLLALGRLRAWQLSEQIVWHLCTGMVHSPQKAIAELSRYVEADAGDVHSRLALARYYTYVDRSDEAVSLLQEIPAEIPATQRAEARGLLAEALVAQSSLAEARETLGGELPSSGDPPGLWRAHGSYAAAVADWQTAVTCLEEAVREHPDDITALYNLGLCLERTGQREAAARVLERSRLSEELYTSAGRLLGVDPQHVDLQFEMSLQISRILLRLERPDEARKWLEQAAQLRPSDPELHSLLASLPRYSPGKQVAGSSSPATLESASATEIRRTTPVPKQGVTDSPPGPVNGRIQLVDRHASAGLEFQYNNGHSQLKYLLDSTGGGVAVLDYDADGEPDLFFPQGGDVGRAAAGGELGDRLYRRRGDGQCLDVTDRAGLNDTQYGQGCAAGDFDNDGFIDLFVANYGTNIVYRNNGDGTFADVTAQTGIAGARWNASLALTDLDRDGLLDLYVATYVLDPLKVCRDAQGAAVSCSPAVYEADVDLLYRNRGDGTFEDASLPAGVQAPGGKGLGVVSADLDDDGWPDLYISNDGTPNFLFRNLTGATPDGALRFEEIGVPSGSALSEYGSPQAGMGIACADLTGDGRLDLHVTNFLDDVNTLYENLGSFMFSDATRRSGLAAPTRAFLGFGTQALDLDLDGRLEVFVANGHIDDLRARGEPWQMRPQLFYNRGGARFDEISLDSGDYFQGEYLGRGVARLDWNSDSRPDLVVVHQDCPAALLENQTPECGHGVLVELRGVQSNRDAIGARLQVTAGGRTQVHEVCGGDGFFASNDHRQCIGLADATHIDSLAIRWPSGRTEQWEELSADAHVLCIEGRAPILRPLSPEHP